MLSRTYEMCAEFFDVDSMGVVWHGNYAKFLEIARCRLLDEAHFNYIKMRQKGFALPIIKMDLKYVKPILFNDRIFVEITLQECDVLLKFIYKILNAKEETLCIAHTTQAATTLQGEVIFEIPRDLQESLMLL